MIKVMITDDHAIVRQGLKQILSETGDISVTGEAENGIQAIRIIRQQAFDVMLLDIGMPGMNGWEVLENLKDRWPQSNFPVIVLTAFDDPANKLIGKLQDRVYRYMTKPFNPEDVVQTVREALGISS